MDVRQPCDGPVELESAGLGVELRTGNRLAEQFDAQDSPVGAEGNEQLLADSGDADGDWHESGHAWRAEPPSCHVARVSEGHRHRVADRSVVDAVPAAGSSSGTPLRQLFPAHQLPSLPVGQSLDRAKRAAAFDGSLTLPWTGAGALGTSLGAPAWI